MGDPGKSRRAYKGPRHPWEGWRIEAERPIKKDYGLKNKKEIWKAKSELKRITSQVKSLIREKNKGSQQALREEKQLLDRLVRYGLVSTGIELADVLSLELNDILNRRLQTLVYRKSMALTPKQSRQFIVHGHISIKGNKVCVPSYLVSKEEEDLISFNSNSTISSEEHPERVKRLKAQEAAKNKAKIEKTEAKIEGELTEEELKRIEAEVGEVVAE